MSYFCLNLGQTAEDSDMFTIIWLRPRGLNRPNNQFEKFWAVNRKSILAWIFLTYCGKTWHFVVDQVYKACVYMYMLPLLVKQTHDTSI